MEEANTMGIDNGNESRHSLPMGVGNDKRVDRKDEASSDCSDNVFWESSGREMVEQNWVFNLQTANRKNRTNKIYVWAIPNATLQELFVQMDSDLGCEVTCDVRTIKEYIPAISFVKKMCVTNGQRGTNCGGILGPQRTKFNVSYCSTFKHVYTRKQKR